MTIPALPRRWQPSPGAAASDGVILATLALATLLSRLPFRTSMLFNWDSANFALATRWYDVTQHQPHPPGYLLYVAVGRLLLPLFDEANAALVAVSLALSVGVPPLTYLLGKALFGRLVGLGAALFVLTSVTFWSYGGLALAYPALALFASWVAWSSYRTTWQGQPGAWLPLAVSYGLGAGFRPDLLFLLGPLWAAGLLRLGWRRALATVAVTGLAVLGWLVPTVALSGGLAPYLAVLTAYTDRDVLERYSSTRGGLAALLATLRDLASYSWYALYATTLPLLAGLIALIVRRPRWDGRALFFTLWLVPPFAFYTIIHVGDPGYLFSVLPALALLASQATVSLARWWAPRWGERLAAVGIGLLVLANASIFLFVPRLLTVPGLREHDRLLAAKIAYLRTLPNDGSTLLLAYESYRHLQYYLPEWRTSLWVDPFAPQPVQTALAPETHWLLLVDARLTNARGNRPGAELLPEVAMVRVPVSPGQRLTFGADVLSLD
ncbi:MAG: glycosyltransferase family 39 protein [Chloroflexi bacterium]|nr:glycosyltransferase family 39 protein [Chloroflexota bacterium]